MTHVPFLLGPHIEQHRSLPVFVREPVGQLLGRDPVHFRKTMPKRFLQEEPIEAAHGEQRESGQDQTAHDESKSRVRHARASSGNRIQDFHGKECGCLNFLV